jgi:superfamily II DNA or RNA helicase
MNFDLHVWQDEALKCWIKNNNRGIVEAVTGSGKTYLALGALHHLYSLDANIRTIVVVPTITLQTQWKERIEKLLPGTRVGRWGGGHKDNFGKHDVIVSTIHTAVAKGPERLRRLGTLTKWKKFLVADECHHYVYAEQFRKIRGNQFYWDCVLAITATLGQDLSYLEGFGKIIYTYDFPKAVKDGLVPRFNLLNTSVPLKPKEKANYYELSEEFLKRIDWVKEVYSSQIDNVPDAFFFRQLSNILKNEPGDHIPIRAMFKTMFERTAISYMAYYKMKLAKDLITLLTTHGNRKVLVFFERIASIEDMVDAIVLDNDSSDKMNLADEAIIGIGSHLKENLTGSWIGEIHSGLKQDEREQKLEEFKKEHPAVLLTCRMLDEGIDVQDIDAAILVASTKSKRQRIQRFGRVLRKGENKPIIITLIVPETTDGNVIIQDDEFFDGAADIYQSSYDEAREKVIHLLEDKEDLPHQVEDMLPDDHWFRKINNETRNISDPNEIIQIMFITCIYSGRSLEFVPNSPTCSRAIEKSILSTQKRLGRKKANSEVGEIEIFEGNTVKTITTRLEDLHNSVNLPGTIRSYVQLSHDKSYFFYKDCEIEDEEQDPWKKFLI